MELKNKANMTVTKSGQFGTGQSVDGCSGQLYRAGVGLIEGSKDMQQGALSSTGRTHNTHELPFFKRNVDTAKHLQGAVFFRNPVRR